MLSLFFKTFVTIFLAELGDKTQFATMGLATEGKGHWVVFAGSALALVVSSALAVLLGAKLVKIAPQRVIQAIAGCLFIIFGIIYLKSALTGPKGV